MNTPSREEILRALEAAPDDGRRALVALGAAAVPGLLAVLGAGKEEERERARAAVMLGAIADVGAVPALIAALAHPNYVCVCAAGALAAIGDPAALPALIAVVRDQRKFWVPRGAAAVALGAFGAAAGSALPALREALGYACEGAGEKWDTRAREAVADAIRRIESPDAESELRGARYEMWSRS